MGTWRVSAPLKFKYHQAEAEARPGLDGKEVAKPEELDGSLEAVETKVLDVVSGEDAARNTSAEEEAVEVHGTLEKPKEATKLNTGKRRTRPMNQNPTTSDSSRKTNKETRNPDASFSAAKVIDGDSLEGIGKLLREAKSIKQG